MKVVILCGGKGTRLGEVTGNLIPKPMVEINGKPVIWHLMKSYADAGFDDFILCAGHRSFAIKQYFLDYQARNSDIQLNTSSGTTHYLEGDCENWNVTIADTGEETQTAGRLIRIAKYLDDDDFFLTYGDGLSDIDLIALKKFHADHGKEITLTGVVPPGRFGEMNLDGDQITELREKPFQTDRFINGGFMVMKRSFIENFCVGDTDNIMLERAPLENAATAGQLMMFRHVGFWQCMDTMRDWELLDRLARQNPVPWKC